MGAHPLYKPKYLDLPMRMTKRLEILEHYMYYYDRRLNPRSMHFVAHPSASYIAELAKKQAAIQELYNSEIIRILDTTELHELYKYNEIYTFQAKNPAYEAIDSFMTLFPTKYNRIHHPFEKKKLPYSIKQFEDYV